MSRLALSSKVFNIVFKDRYYYRFSNIVFQCFLFILFLLFATSFYNLHNFLNTASSKLTFYAFYKKDSTAAQIEGARKMIENWPEVNRVRVISRDDGLAILKSSLGRESAILKTIDANPLPVTLEINIKPEFTEKQTVAQIEEKLKIYDRFEWTDSTQKYLGSLLQLRTFFNRLFVAAVLALVVIIFVTLRISTRSLLYRYRESLSLLRLLGASNRFIILPFVLEGVIETFVSSILSSFACLYMTGFLNDNLARLGITILSLPHTAYLFFIVSVALTGALGGFTFAKVTET